MCLAVPGKVVKVDGRSALVDFEGVTKRVQLDLLEGTKPGDFVLVHAGYAIQTLDKGEAGLMLKSWKELLGAEDA
jgi:hydrogenase expression/formation protein HypC